MKQRVREKKGKQNDREQRLTCQENKPSDGRHEEVAKD